MVGGLILVPITLFNCDHAFATDIPHGWMGGGQCHILAMVLAVTLEDSLVCKSTANSTSRQSTDLIFALFVANLSGLQIIIKCYVNCAQTKARCANLN